MSPLRSGLILDVSFLGPQIGGIGRYTVELGRGLLAHRDVRELRFWDGQKLREELLAPTVAGRPPHPLIARFDRWKEGRRLRSSIFHGPNYFLPASVERGVITVHDLSVFRHPETHPPERIVDFERRFASSLSRAAHVLTDTETIRAELIETFGTDPDRVTAIPLGVGAEFRPRPAQTLAAFLATKDLEPGRYGLCVSQTEPRKKLLELIRAWRALPEALRRSYPLALAGGSGWQNDAIREEIDAGAREGWLRPLGFIAEDDLPALYAGAVLFIYPSIYEGFGLPPLEAMASGVPVLVANRSCLPEVCGEAPRFVDPDDSRGFTDAIAEALEDRGWRENAAARGIARAAQFTWSRCVEETIAVYRKVEAAA